MKVFMSCDMEGIAGIVDWDQVSQVVTDEEPAAPWREFFDSHEISLRYPPQGQVTGAS